MVLFGSAEGLGDAARDHRDEERPWEAFAMLARRREGEQQAEDAQRAEDADSLPQDARLDDVHALGAVHPAAGGGTARKLEGEYGEAEDGRCEERAAAHTRE